MRFTIRRLRLTVSTAAAAAATALAATIALPTPASPAPSPVGATSTAAGLPRLNITSSYVTGISSGGYMATQLQVAYSSRFRGAGIFSAGPYYCAQQSLALALAACTANTTPTELPKLIAQTDQYAQAGKIDPTSNLATQPTWFFWGTKDQTVVGSVADDLAAYYRHYRVPLKYRNSEPAGHAWISRLGLNPCGVTSPPFINDCGPGVDTDMLSTMFGSVKPRNTGAPRGEVISFSQDPYAAPAKLGAGDPARSGAAAIGMGPSGYAYVPSSCKGGTPCKLVVALHGCRQTAGEIGTTFVKQSGLNEFADTNRFVVLYPQANRDETFGNPKGCWDWWGYLGPNDDDYATRGGPQMATVMSMVGAVKG
ncbi:MAG: poly(3-hydroxybutyrate) depolymerase [Actinomycetota bacterium]|nr:poly(3-hydroxybutyrate) depolymerase [Actinomycetota bacterium]